MEKIGKSIVEKLKTRTEIVKQYTDSHSGLVQGGLVNFACYLKWQQKVTLSRWVLLNDCVREEHPA